MNRSSIINSLIHKIGANHYLEIGSFDGETFDKILCSNRVSVDPVNPRCKSGGLHYQMTSDQFFAQNSELFDVIFVDGLHHADQVYRDIENSLNSLRPGGFIVCHDMNPIAEEHQAVPFVSGIWNGDCWKALVKVRQTHPDLYVCTVDTDHGCSVITKNLAPNPLSTTQELVYKNLDSNRKQWLNLIQPSEFISQFGLCDSLDAKLALFIGDPDDSQNNFILALHYDSLGQRAAALSYYLRAAERTDQVVFQYECIVKAALAFDGMGMRALSVRGLLDKAITLMPTRPEAYYLLSRWYERQNNIDGWMQSYTIASLGIQFCERAPAPLRTRVDYPGFYGLLFEKAVSGWWIGQCQESCDIFIELHSKHDLDTVHRSAVISNLKQLNQFQSKKLNLYSKNYHQRLKFKFKGSDAIDQNFSEAYQDMFVLSVLNGKTGGSFLEIGSGNPFYGNNTALLEKQFGWTGIAVDLDTGLANSYNQHRKSRCFNANALEIDYEKLLSENNMPAEIDYLQIDIDPAEVSLECLKKIPFSTRKFGVITFEHDAYTQLDPQVRTNARKILAENGYIPMARNIAPDHWRYYEDWWVRADLAKSNMIDSSEDTKSAESYMLFT